MSSEAQFDLHDDFDVYLSSFCCLVSVCLSIYSSGLVGTELAAEIAETFPHIQCVLRSRFVTQINITYF